MRHESDIPTGNHTYSRGSRLLAEAARGFSIKISDEKERDWNVVLRTVHYLDSVIDSPDITQESRDSRVTETLQYILGTSENITRHSPNGCALCEFRDMASGWNDQQREYFTSVVTKAQKIAMQRNVAVKPGTLAQLAALDGYSSADLVIFREPTNPSKTAFDRWVQNLFAAGTVVDTAVDLRSDFDLGLTVVKPTAMNRSIIAAHALPYGPSLIKGAKTRVVRNLIRSFAAMVGDVKK